MNVRIYDIDQQTSKETFRCVSDLRECFPDDENEFQIALAEIKRAGRYWCGGGAFALTLLVQADRS